jgi:lysophospholipid acyltransferase (LPLAT)-like uncharacterized protein
MAATPSPPKAEAKALERENIGQNVQEPDVSSLKDFIASKDHIDPKDSLDPKGFQDHIAPKDPIAPDCLLEPTSLIDPGHTPKNEANKAFVSLNDEDPSLKFFCRWPRFLADIALLFSRLCRFRHFGYPSHFDGPAIFICWHSEETTLLPRCGFTRGRIMISRSRDGDILASVVRRWGYLVSRGSSSRGAVAALRTMRAALDNGDNLILAVDGPRGPRRVAKPGAYYLAAKTGRPIYPVGAAVSFAHVFKKSWSLSRLPLPFSKICAVFGPPLRPTLADLKKTGPERGEELARALDAATLEAENRLKNWPGTCL